MAFHPILVSLLNMDLGWGNRMDSFFKSDQTQCVVQLLSVYQEEGKMEWNMLSAQAAYVIPYLDRIVNPASL